MDVTYDGPLKIAIVFPTLYKVVLWFVRVKEVMFASMEHIASMCCLMIKIQHLYPYNPYNWKNIIIMLLRLLFSFTYVVKGRMMPG